MDNYNSHLIYGHIFSISNRIQTLGDSHFKEITFKQHFLLVTLSLFMEPPTLGEVARIIGCSYQNIKRLATELEKKGYIKISRDVADRRKLLLVKCEKYFQLEKENNEVTRSFMDGLFKGINEKDMEITLSALAKMNKNLGGSIFEK